MKHLYSALPISAIRIESTYPLDMDPESGALKSEKDWLVQKYGGTSIGKFPQEIANIICNDFKHNRLAVVCSARSSGVKADGTTTK